jgi:hypothetical protein
MPHSQNTTQKSISIVFLHKRFSSLSKYCKQKQTPLEIPKMAHVQGGDCFCLWYLLSDESWRIALTRKTMKMVCVVFCHCWAHIFVVKVVCHSPQHRLFQRMQNGSQFKYPHPRERVSIKFPRVGNKNQSNAPHMPNLPPPPPPPWD